MGNIGGEVKVSVIAQSEEGFKTRFPYGDIVGTSPTGFGTGWGEGVQVDAIMPYEFFPSAGDTSVVNLPCAIGVQEGDQSEKVYLAERGGVTRHEAHAARMTHERAKELIAKTQPNMPEGTVLRVVTF